VTLERVGTPTGIFPKSNRFAFTLQPSVFGGLRSVIIDEKQCRPEKHDTDTGCFIVILRILIQMPGELRSAGKNLLAFLHPLGAGIVLILKR